MNHSNPYEDIFDCPRPMSHVRPLMSIKDRAAQFAPFAALTGHQAAIQETARLTQARRQLTEEEKEQLDYKQRLLLAHRGKSPQVTVTYFCPDMHKEGGAYQVVTVHVKSLDLLRRLMRTEEGRDIPLDEIVSLDSELFPYQEL